MSKDTGGAYLTCSVCKDAATIKQGNQNLCDKHYRFGQMRSSAKRNGKAVPTRSQLDQMIGLSLDCPDCGIRMNWRSKDGKATVATLQHYRNGDMGIVCLSCNVRHSSMPGDTYREMDKTNKLCPSCGIIKNLSCFYSDRSREGIAKRKSHCNECSHQHISKWRKEKADEYNAYQRRYRAKRKAEGNPVR